jgi:ribosomal protein S18 acetylase RimI-like enzyme
MTLSQANPDQFLPPDDDRRFGPVIRVGPDRRRDAVERLVGSSGHGERSSATRFLSFAEENQIPLDSMWARLDPAGQVEASVLAVPSPGRTAMMFASHPPTRRAVPSLGALIDHARRRGPTPEWPPGATVHTYDDHRREELVSILEATYEGTLDCPDLCGRRDTADILEGHRSTGRFDPSLWTILRLDGRPAGVLLMNPSNVGGSIELVYVGLAPFARGRGLATQLLRHGLSLLGGRSERTISLAVDDRNAPALTLYRREGFRPVLRRIAMIRSIRTPSRR